MKAIQFIICLVASLFLSQASHAQSFQSYRYHAPTRELLIQRGIPSCIPSMSQDGKELHLTIGSGRGPTPEFSDLSLIIDLPIMPITSLDLNRTGVTDLTPLSQLPLRYLTIKSTVCSDYSPLRHLSLESLCLDDTEAFSDLEPLANMPLRFLTLIGTSVRDLSPLKGMPIVSLRVASTAVADLTPLHGMTNLISLAIWDTNVRDLEPLRGLPLVSLSLGSTPVTDLTPLQNLPLTNLSIGDTQVTDFSPLKGMPIRYLRLCPKTAPLAAQILPHLTELRYVTVARPGVAGQRYTPDEFLKIIDAHYPKQRGTEQSTGE